MIEATEHTKTRREHRSVAKIHKIDEKAREIGLNSKKHREVEMARLQKVFGERMYKSRTLVRNWTQEHAAKLMGYKTSSPLAKIEMGGKFPLWMPTVAAKVYRVSVDYLLGVVDFDYECKSPGTEWEISIMEADQGLMKLMMEEHAKHLRKFAGITKATVDDTAQVMEKAQKIIETFYRVKDLNPSIWAEAKGGLGLENAIEQFQRTCNDQRRDAERIRLALKRTAEVAGISPLLDRQFQMNYEA